MSLMVWARAETEGSCDYYQKKRLRWFWQLKEPIFLTNISKKSDSFNPRNLFMQFQMLCVWLWVQFVPIIRLWIVNVSTCTVQVWTHLQSKPLGAIVSLQNQQNSAYCVMLTICLQTQVDFFTLKSSFQCDLKCVMQSEWNNTKLCRWKGTREELFIIH